MELLLKGLLLIPLLWWGYYLLKITKAHHDNKQANIHKSAGLKQFLKKATASGVLVFISITVLGLILKYWINPAL